MESISLIGKVVKVSDPSILRLFYPDFVVKSYLTSYDVGIKVIYTGLLNKRAMGILESCTFIATQGLYSYDLTDRTQMLKFVYSKWNREVNASVLKNVDLYDDEEFSYCYKVYWVCGRWPYKPESEESIYTLYQSSVQPVNEFIKCYFDSVSEYPDGVVEQSFLTFMVRAKNVDDQNVGASYKRLLKGFWNVSGVKFKRAVSRFIGSPICNRELKFVELIFNLR